MKFDLLNASEYDRWNLFVEQHPRGTIYHLSYWKDVIERSFKHIKGQVIPVWSDGMGDIVAGLPVYFVRSYFTGNRLVSAPFALHCEPLVSGQPDMEMIVTALMNYYKESKSDYIELRATTPQSLLAKSNFAVSELYKTHNLALDRPPEQLLKSFHKNAARTLRKALKSDIGLKRGTHEADLLVFYRMLIDSRKRLGLPPIPYKFFKALWDVFKPMGKLDLLLAVADGEPAAAKLLLKHGDTVFFEYGCDVLKHRKLGVNHFLEWEAINLACAEGYKNYSFGRTSIHNRGLLTYKKRWGTAENGLPKFFFPASYCRSDERRESSIKYLLARKVFERAPHKISSILGSFLYRHMG